MSEIPQDTEQLSNDRLKEEIKRLSFDCKQAHSSLPKFDKFTGKELSSEREQLEAMKRDLAQIAEKQMSDALRIGPEDKFGRYKGTPIPGRIIDENGSINLENALGRIIAFRNEIGFLIDHAEKSGIIVDKFDRLTGEPIPRDSLRSLLQAQSLEEQSINDEIREDIDLGLDILSKLQSR